MSLKTQDGDKNVTELGKGHMPGKSMGNRTSIESGGDAIDNGLFSQRGLVPSGVKRNRNRDGVDSRDKEFGRES